MITNEALVEQIEQIGLEELLVQNDLDPAEFEDDGVAAAWADAAEALEWLYARLDLANQRRRI